MKTTTLSILLGLSLTFGAVITSRADSAQTIRIPQGRGQYTETQVVRSELPAAAPLMTTETKSIVVYKLPAERKLRPMVVHNQCVSPVLLCERSR